MEIQWPLVLFTLLTGLGVGAFSCVAVIEWLGIGEVVMLPGTITALVAMGAVLYSLYKTKVMDMEFFYHLDIKGFFS